MGLASAGRRQRAVVGVGGRGLGVLFFGVFTPTIYIKVRLSLAPISSSASHRPLSPPGIEATLGLALGSRKVAGEYGGGRWH
jgi:hypothetical protein